MLDDVGPTLLVDLDFKKSSHAANFPRHIRFEIVVVGETDIRNVTDIPPGLNMRPVGPVMKTILLEPAMKKLANANYRRLKRRTHAARSIFDHVEELGRHMHEVLVPAPDDVSTISSQGEILGFG